MQEKDKNSHISNVKNIFNPENYGDDIRAWINADERRTVAGFAKKAGVSKKTIEDILAWRKGMDPSKKPNPRSNTLEAIMTALDCEGMYTPRHKIK